MKSQLAFALFVLLAQTAVGTRHLQQVVDGSGLPTFQGTNLTIVNANDPSATQTASGNSGTTAMAPTAPAQAPASPIPVDQPVPTPQEQTPAVAPAAQPPSVPLPTIQAPTPAPSQAPPAPVVTPTVPAPAPSRPSQPPTVPAPAPSNATAVPAPAPANTTVLAPAPAPKAQASASVPVPAPAPAPQSPPLCGVKPQCRVFVEDMLCCDNAGAISNKQNVVYQLQCTHPVNYYPKCARVSGPTMVSAFTQFQNAAWSTNHAVQVNFLKEFAGTATLDIEGPRTDGNLSADCGLYISPCLYNGTLVTKVAPVLGLTFTTLDSADFLDVSEYLNYDLDNLDSLVFPNLFYPSACQQQNVAALNETFYSKDWVNYTTGFQNSCNATAYRDALSVTSGTVQTASLSG